MAQQLTDEQNTIKQECRDFLETDKETAGTRKHGYAARIDELVRAGKPGRLLIDITHLNGKVQTINAQSNKPKDLHQKLVENPSEYLRFLNAVVQEEVERRRVEIVATHGGSGTISVGFCGYFGDMKRTPRDLSSQDLNCLVQVEGVVLRANDFNQKIATSVHYNTKTETFVERSYRSQLSLELDNSNLPTVNVMPTKDAQGNPLRTEHGMCTYEDVQMIMLQETPEGAPVGSLPRSVSVCFEKDLVGQCQPGDRVRIVGIYLPHSEEGKDFDTILLANNVEVIGKTTSEYDLTEGDLQNCKNCCPIRPSLLARKVGCPVRPRPRQHQEGCDLNVAGRGGEGHRRPSHPRGHSLAHGRRTSYSEESDPPLRYEPGTHLSIDHRQGIFRGGTDWSCDNRPRHWRQTAGGWSDVPCGPRRVVHRRVRQDG